MASRAPRTSDQITLRLSRGQGASALAASKAPRGSARPGVRGITVHLEQELWLKVKMLALHNGQSTQDLVESWIESAVREHEA